MLRRAGPRDTKGDPPSPLTTPAVAATVCQVARGVDGNVSHLDSGRRTVPDEVAATNDPQTRSVHLTAEEGVKTSSSAYNGEALIEDPRYAPHVDDSRHEAKRIEVGR